MKILRINHAYFKEITQYKALSSGDSNPNLLCAAANHPRRRAIRPLDWEKLRKLRVIG